MSRWWPGRIRRSAQLKAGPLAALVPPRDDFPTSSPRTWSAGGFGATPETVPNTPAARIQADLTHCDTGTRPHAELNAGQPAAVYPLDAAGAARALPDRPRLDLVGRDLTP
ncbi:hypothetical protein GCM10023088_48970 [Actinomadura verrucosospora]